MYFVDTIEVPGLGNRGYLAGGARSAVVVDPPRDVDRVIAAAARRGVRITHVVETHVHNDYVTGGLELARITGAAYLVPAGALVAFERTPVADGDVTEIEDGLALRALATPGHTPHHTSYALEEAGRAAVVFTGGSLLIGTVGRPDLVEPGLTGRLARAQYDSAHRLATELPDETEVLPTHGFGSFCSAGQAEGGATTTIGRERGSNEALVKDVDTFVADLLAGLDDVPAYYAHMGPVNAQGPGPVDLTPPRRGDREEIAARLAAGEWVVDLRDRRAFAEGHVAGTFNFEAEGQLATYLAWLVPWGRPVTLLAATPAQLADAQRELVRVGIDRPAAAATGSPAEWVREGTCRARSRVPRSPTWPLRGPTGSSCWMCGGTRSGRPDTSGARCTFRCTACGSGWRRYPTARSGCTAPVGCGLPWAPRSSTRRGVTWSPWTTGSLRRPRPGFLWQGSLRNRRTSGRGLGPRPYSWTSASGRNGRRGMHPAPCTLPCRS